MEERILGLKNYIWGRVKRERDEKGKKGLVFSPTYSVCPVCWSSREGCEAVISGEGRAMFLQTLGLGCLAPADHQLFCITLLSALPLLWCFSLLCTGQQASSAPAAVKPVQMEGCAPSCLGQSQTLCPLAPGEEHTINLQNGQQKQGQKKLVT